jgi:lipopolysaccharide biosynthesis protein
MPRRARFVAFYLPQYHAIPENDLWWGQGFTDWDNVRRSRPLFAGHYQPREPEQDRYYDLSKVENIRWQIDLARAHNVYGFCHYHYWFDGKQLLETPTNLFLADKSLDLNFCLAWANETWSKRWDGMDHYVLQLQTHVPDRQMWERHFQYLIKAWTDERAIRINGNPLFIIYRPYKIPELGNMFDYWRTRARKYGVGNLCFLTMKQFHFVDEACLKHFDGYIHFQPFDAMHSLSLDRPRPRRRIRARLPKGLSRLLEEAGFAWQKRFGKPTFYDYDEVWVRIIRNTMAATPNIYPGAFVDWDNSPRYGRRARVFTGVSPQRFEYWIRKLLAAVETGPLREPLIFVNAWNEWAEGTYLEPDKKFGSGFLRALRDAQHGVPGAPPRSDPGI